MIGAPQIVEILFLGGALALPIGFAVSSAVALRQTTGPRRKISALILVLAAALFTVLAVLTFGASQIPYQARRPLVGTCMILSAAGILCVYLAHTYWPTQRRAVNLPATLGLCAFCLSVIPLVLF